MRSEVRGGDESDKGKIELGALAQDGKPRAELDLYVRQAYSVYDSDMWAANEKARAEKLCDMEVVFKIVVDLTTGKIRRIVQLSFDRALTWTQDGVELELVPSSKVDAEPAGPGGSCTSVLEVVWGAKRSFLASQHTGLVIRNPGRSGSRMVIHAFEENMYSDRHNAYDNVGTFVDTPDVFFVTEMNIWWYGEEGGRRTVEPIWPRKEWEAVEIPGGRVYRE
jgi:hypothetical protein